MGRIINSVKENYSLFFYFLILIGVPFFIWNIWLWHYILKYMDENLDKYLILEDYLYFPTWLFFSVLISLFWTYVYIKFSKKNSFGQ